MNSILFCIYLFISRQKNVLSHLWLGLAVHRRRRRLVCREHQHLGNIHMRGPSRHKYNHLCNIMTRQRLYALVHRVGLPMIALEPHDRELGLDHARVDLRDADVRVHGLEQKRLGDRGHRGLGCTVDRSVAVGLLARYGANVDDVALVPGAHPGKYGLGDVHKAFDVGVDHGVYGLL